MDIKNAKYCKDEKDNNICIRAKIDGVEMDAPLDKDNRHYAEIKRQVDAGELTIEDAD